MEIIFKGKIYPSYYFSITALSMGWVKPGQLLHTMRPKGWALVFICCILLYLFFSSFHSVVNSKLSISSDSDIIVQKANPYRRSNHPLLISALAHVLASYVANRTPDFDTPPLLVLYTCKHDSQCGPLEERLASIVNGYLFSALYENGAAAFAVDMDTPVKFEWFFEPTPSYMSMHMGQADFYSSRADPATIKTVDSISASELSNVNFADNFRENNVRILRYSHLDSWKYMQQNPSLQRHMDQYRLGDLSVSEGFWLASRLLFHKPSGWLSNHLIPYRDLMGGTLYADPLGRFESPVLDRWMRIGIHVTDSTSARCLASRVASVCSRTQVMGKKCHVFLSAPSSDMIETMRAAIGKHRQKDRPIVLHAVADGYDFAPSQHQELSLLESEEQHLKMAYARLYMDWIILSRMDYLLGSHGDEYLKTAAWAAQVQTDLVYPNDQDDECRIESLQDW